jgi:lysozyme
MASVKPRLIQIALGAAFAVGLVVLGVARGWWRPTQHAAERFAVWGVDISHHQHAVDWPRVVAGAPRIRFAYLKATEGKDWTDARFADNWRDARAAGLRVGAYHFYTFCSDPLAQAQHFLSVVPRDPQALPPVIDLEFGGNCRAVPSREEVRRGVDVFLAQVERTLGRKAVMYVTREAYDALVKDSSNTNPLWIRDLVSPPNNPPWVFWQFANRGRLSGVEGFVDLNVFVGELDALDRLP